MSWEKQLAKDILEVIVKLQQGTVNDITMMFALEYIKDKCRGILGVNDD